MHGTVAKECALRVSIIQLVRFIWPRVWKTWIAKNPEHMIIRMHVKHNSKRYSTFERCDRKLIDQIHSS